MRRTACYVAVMWIGCAGAAHAWGPSAHMYVAMRIVGEGWMDALYGSMLPDMFGFASTPAIKSQIQHLTHFEPERLAPGSFALGFTTHNGTWGADYYSHAYYDPHAPDTYLTARMRILSNEFGLTMNQAEDVVEATVDYILRRNRGPAWGTLMAATTDVVGGAQEQQMVDAFAVPLSARVSGLSLSAAESELRTMFRQHVLLTRIYGQQLAIQDDPFIRATLITGFAAYFHVDETTATQYFTRAEDVCWDVEDELDAIAMKVNDELKTTPNYLPLGALVVAVQGLLVAAAFLRMRRRWTCDR